MSQNLREAFLNRRSVRLYTGAPIPEDQLKTVLEVGLLSESGNNRREWEYILVKDPAHLASLTRCKAGSGKMLEKAGAAIVVAVDPEKSDIWYCDGAIALANMHITADALGLGSCYINALNRKSVDGGEVEDYLKEDLGLPAHFRVVGMLALGIPAAKPALYDPEKLDWSKVHAEHFGD